MSILIGPRMVPVTPGTIRSYTFPLANGSTAFEGGAACYDTAAFGSLKNANTGSATLVAIGTFLSSPGLNSSGGAIPVQVQLAKEIELSYWDSVAGGGAITIANLFQLVYWADDHTLTTVSTTASVAGRVWTLSPGGYPGGVGLQMAF